MFNITTAKNKYGEKAYELDINEEEKEGLYNYYYRFEIDLPQLNSSIFLDYNFSRVNSNTILSDETFEDFTVFISANEEIINLYGLTRPQDRYDEKRIRNFDLNNLVKIVCAYAYVKQNYRDLVLNGMTKRDLKRIDINKLEELAKFSQTIQQEFKRYMTEICKGEKLVDAQSLVDQLFGDCKIDVDKITEDNISEALKQREEEREFAEEILEMLRRTLYTRLKDGEVKSLSPFKLIKEKIFGLKYKMAKNKTEKAEKIVEKRYKKVLLHTLDENPREI